MKVTDDISPWKVTEKTETKQFNDDAHFSLPKMNLQPRKQGEEDEKMGDQRFSSNIFLKSHTSLQMLKSKSMSDSWGRKLSEYKKGQISSPHQKSRFRPSPPLVSIKKTYKYHELIAKSGGFSGRQSTPIIKQRMQVLLKAYEVQEVNQNCLKSLTNEQIMKIQKQKLGTKKTNIQFMYNNELKMKRNLLESPSKKSKVHILDNLLSVWER